MAEARQKMGQMDRKAKGGDSVRAEGANEAHVCMVKLSPGQIKEIASEIIKQLQPLLAATSQEDPSGAGAALEIAKVRAAGLDLVEYLKMRAKTGRRL